MPDARLASPGGPDPASTDDSLILLFMSCHPSLSITSQIALTLRAIGGLGTPEIGRALLVPESTVARRITRAKRSIIESGVPFALPSAQERERRLDAVLRVLYLIYNEGYASTRGSDLQRVELAHEAIRLARMVHHALPDDSEVTGLLALMLLTHARHRARTGLDGSLIPLADQDRADWDAGAMREGISLITDALPRGSTGPYQLQAAIAAVHDEAASWEETDWPQILALYEVLLRVDPSPIVRLNHAVAVAMVHGPEAGLERLATVSGRGELQDDRRFHAVHAHLLAMTGDRTAALDAYAAAAERATNLQQQRYIHAQMQRLRD